MEMDKSPMEPLPKPGSQAGQLIADCVTNPIILKELLKHFSNSELLELSLVNKMWSYEARSVIKKRGNLTALLGCDSCDPCQQEFEDFGVDLQQMNVVPYSAVDMTICGADHTGRFPLDLSYEFLVLKKLLENFSGSLEQLTLDVEEKRLKFIRNFVQDCSFPFLKVLKLRDAFNTSDEAYTRYIRALVSRSPNLQELHVSGEIDLTINVLEGSNAVLMHQKTVYAPFDDIPDKMVHALVLRSVVLEYPDPDFDFSRFNRIAHVLLQASCKTLHCINLDAVFAVPLMCYGICFENTHHRLVMAIHNNELELDAPQILSIVKNFDFTRVFPKMKLVEIICRSAPEFSTDHLNEIIEQADAVLGEPMPDRAAYIKDLYIDSCSFSNETVAFYAEMFPNIQNLEVATVNGQETPFGSIWKHWPDLEKLDVYIYEQIPPNARNLDGVFCGIFLEEVEELRQRDEEYLKSVNIVPVMLAITCVRGLKTLSLNYRDRQGEPFVDDGTFVFSKVAALVALARCPEITVSLNISSYYSDPPVTYLKPYISVESVLRGEFDL